MRFPEKFRAQNPLIPFVANDPEGGYFKIPHPDLADTWFLVVANNGEYWQHVAVALGGIPRCPTWEEMCWIKDQFFLEETPVMQLHPPRSQWISNHPYALHLWKPVDAIIPLPPPVMVGYRILDA
jgi:hypothetical protein